MQHSNSRRVLTQYPVHVDILPRYSDVDPQGHINNVAVAEFYQESRLGFHRALNAMFWERPPKPKYSDRAMAPSAKIAAKKLLVCLGTKVRIVGRT